MLRLIWTAYCLPGILILWVRFISPTEWGKKRNVSRTARRWRNRRIFSPLISTAIYLFLILAVLGDIGALSANQV